MITARYAVTGRVRDMSKKTLAIILGCVAAALVITVAVVLLTKNSSADDEASTASLSAAADQTTEDGTSAPASEAPVSAGLPAPGDTIKAVDISGAEKDLTISEDGKSAKDSDGREYKIVYRRDDAGKGQENTQSGSVTLPDDILDPEETEAYEPAPGDVVTGYEIDDSDPENPVVVAHVEPAETPSESAAQSSEEPSGSSSADVPAEPSSEEPVTLPFGDGPIILPTIKLNNNP